ncbi:EpsG family protein [Marinobacter sp. F3R11]|uniref:EpsG family protein n=1 Tax=Marinobacter sp. F3R11 TaxID=2267231 RepID=UPI000DEA2EC8|nr:EpsG family protein [Marinobacter sp. F3R11]RBW48261.1 hypothetical protein DS878_08635 [Marinobacter sp. F3R11]
MIEGSRYSAFFQKQIVGGLRLFFIVIFSLFYFYFLYKSVYGVELKSDYLQYYNAYNEGLNLRFDRFGVEFVPVLFYRVGNFIGLDYYQFNYFLGVMWIVPFYFLMKSINFIFFGMVFYFLMFFFLDQFAFLYRQFLGLFFLILFFKCYRSSSVCGFFYVFISFFSHLSMFLFFSLSCIKLRSRLVAYLFVLISGFGFFSNIVSLLFLKIFGLFSLIGLPDLDRKLSAIERISSMAPASSSVSFVLIVSLFIHASVIHLDVDRFSFMRMMFFCSVIVLVFSDYIIISNRLGMPAYFLSLIYLSLVLSRFYDNYKFSIFPGCGFRK